jgi:pilus assembly protein CpaF
MSFELILPFLRPIEPMLMDENISEIMGNPDASWWYEREGIIHREKTISVAAGKLRTSRSPLHFAPPVRGRSH